MGSTSFVGTGTTVGRPPFMVRSSFLVFVVFLIAIFVFELCRELGNLLLSNDFDSILLLGPCPCCLPRLGIVVVALVPGWGLHPHIALVQVDVHAAALFPFGLSGLFGIVLALVLLLLRGCLSSFKGLGVGLDPRILFL